MKKRSELTGKEWDAARYRLKDRAEGEPPYGPSSATPMDDVVIYLFLAIEELEEKIDAMLAERAKGADDETSA